MSQIVKAVESYLQCRSKLGRTWADGHEGIQGDSSVLGKGGGQETLGPRMWECSLGVFMVKFQVEVSKAGFSSAKLHDEQRQPSLAFVLLDAIKNISRQDACEWQMQFCTRSTRFFFFFSYFSIIVV